MSVRTHRSVLERSQLTLTEVAVVRGGHRVLTDVSLTVVTGSRIAIVGENGRGKSTLLHVLAGTLTPTSGRVVAHGTVGIAEQELIADDDRTVGDIAADAIADSQAVLSELDLLAAAMADGEDVAAAYGEALENAESLDAWDAERRVRLALDELGVSAAWDRPLTELSVGERYRVRLACLLGGTDDFLLLDELTNHLDARALDFLTASVRTRRGGVVIVSHDRALLADLDGTVVDLDPTPDGRPAVYGSFEDYRPGREAMWARWRQEFDRERNRRQQLVDDLSAAQNRLVSGWRPPKGTGKHQRATRAGGLVRNVRRRQEDLDAHRLTTPPPPQRFSMPEVATRPGSGLLVAEDVTVRDRLTRPTSLRLSGGDRLLVTGPNGAGKSTLLAVLAGDLVPDTGRVVRLGGARIVTLRQESDLPADVRAADFFAQEVHRHGGPDIGLSSLGLLRSTEAGKRVGELSTGQVRRLELAIAVASMPDVLLLDEPTNHLSIALVDELTDALQATRSAVVVSTHDRQMLRDLSGWARMRLP
ncbi:ABC-F family ATP-binding cassette domain-containing protein [Gordonia phthalatica]|uniref:ABC transporter n=1 Tax=Gordonia phthalatica TaxID=1136941 RepID=A0A0N7FUH9_9ACTN|nr:ABC-F family ATP-binding cassette domain-containing protein [Gordonia phthalatica]ALG84407.1 ABC transporter [Gordonia phthalatica]